MLKKCFSAAGLAVLASVAAVWIGCSSDNTGSVPPTDGGTTNTDLPDSAGSTPTDSGSSSGNQAADLDGGVAITYGVCPTFTKCGGDVVGNWKVTGGCLDKSTFDVARKSCADLQESEVKIQAVGTVVFTATEITRNTTQQLTGKVFIPTNSATCAGAKGLSCGIIAFGLESGQTGLKFDDAQCTATTTPEQGCNCAVARKITDSTTAQSYTAADSTLTTSNPTQTYDYCVAGTTNTYTETTQGQDLKLYVTIAKQ